ncbi:MAG: hydrolase, partial [Firmicutes bacterium]|nr:hydrolase [Bacillota bacterium]
CCMRKMYGSRSWRRVLALVLVFVMMLIGSSHAGVMTFSLVDIRSSLRRSLPIQTGLAKFLDLDRCFTVNRMQTTNGKELVLINLHLSAYTTDDTIVTQQVQMLMDTMQEEYAKGNYVIAGGDFNMDLLGNSSEIFGVSGEDYSWAQPFPERLIPDGITLYAPLDETNPVPSCRNADSPWDPETNFQLTIDGFLITDNIRVDTVEVVDTQFAYSDHNPVHLRFSFVN